MRLTIFVLGLLISMPAFSQEVLTIFCMEKNKKGEIKDSCRAGSAMVNEAGKITLFSLDSGCADSLYTIKYIYKEGRLIQQEEQAGQAKNTYTVMHRKERPWRYVNQKNRKDTRLCNYSKEGVLTEILFLDSNQHFYRTSFSFPKEGWMQKIHYNQQKEPVLIENALEYPTHFEFTQSLVAEEPYAIYRIWLPKAE